MNVFKPEVFQGKLTGKHYFEGWYFKNVSSDLSQVYSFIPGISLNAANPHAFIQVINGITGKTQYVEYLVSEFTFEKDSFLVKIGNSVFTSDYMHLDIDSPLIKVSGQIGFSNVVKYPSSLFSPGIMGWYSFVPFMECKHGVVSVSHGIDGDLWIDNQKINFFGGRGYIEKDWGKSFPESWIWLQSNNFQNSDACIMLSIAKIPWLGSYFTGFLGFLYYEKEFYPFSTYLKSKITEFKLIDGKVVVHLKSKKHELHIVACPKNSGVLLAPKLGQMSRRIKESVDSELDIQLHDKSGTLLYSDKAARAGLEVIDSIFDLVRTSNH